MSAHKPSTSNLLCARILYSSLWLTWQALWHPRQLDPHFLSISWLQIRSPCCSYAKCCNSVGTQAAWVASSLSLTLWINGSASLFICSSAGAWPAFMIMRLFVVLKGDPRQTVTSRRQVANCFRLLHGHICSSPLWKTEVQSVMSWISYKSTQCQRPPLHFCISLLNFQQAVGSRVLFSTDQSLCEGCSCVSWASGFGLWSALASVHFSLSTRPASWSHTKTAVSGYSCCALSLHMHRNIIFMIITPPKCIHQLRQASVEVLWSWIHAKWQDVEAALPAGGDECTKLLVFFLCWWYLSESRVGIGICKPFNRIQLCQQLVLWCQTVSL